MGRAEQSGVCWGSEANVAAGAVPSACGLLQRRKALVWRLGHRWEDVYGLLVDGVLFLCQGSETRKGDAYTLSSAVVSLQHKYVKKTRAHAFPAQPPIFYIHAKVPGSKKLCLRVETQEAVDSWLKALCGASASHRGTMRSSLSRLTPADVPRAPVAISPAASASDAPTELPTEATSEDLLTYDSENQLLTTACSMASMRSVLSHATQSSASRRSRSTTLLYKPAVDTATSGKVSEGRQHMLIPPSQAHSAMPPTPQTDGATTWAMMKEELGRAFLRRKNRQAAFPPPTTAAASSQPDPVVDVGFRRLWPASHSYAGADGRPSPEVHRFLPPTPSTPIRVTSSSPSATPVSSSRWSLDEDTPTIVCKCCRHKIPDTSLHSHDSS